MTIIYISISWNTIQSLKIVKNGTTQNEYEMNIHNTANCHWHLKFHYNFCFA